MKLLVSIFSSLLICSLTISSSAQPGSLDNTFGTGGKSIISFGNFGDRGNSLAIQSDGKIVLGGFTQSSFTTSDFALLRCNNDGTLDASFGIDGKVITTIESRSKANSVAIQSDGKILLGGNSNWFINLVRYNNNGTLDTTFGAGGKVITDVQGYYSEQCKSIAIQNDGKILVGGYGQHNANDNSYFILMRYTTNGTLDSTFGTNGIVIGGLGLGNTLAIQSDGKIVLGGATDFTFELVRYNTDGTLDTNFGTNGIVSTIIGTSAQANAMAICNSGKIVVGGFSYTTSSNSDFTMAQYNNNGSLDNTFGIAGIVVTSIGSSSSAVNSLTIQSDGKIVLAGNASNGTNYADFALVRYLADGTLDASFGTNGKVITTIGVSYSIGNSLTTYMDNKILVGGFSHNGSKTDIALVCYNNNATTVITETNDEQHLTRIIPNPFTNSTIIQLNTPLNNAEITIYNICGQKIKQLTAISGQEIKITSNNLPSGIYFLQIIDEHKIISVEKLIIN